MRYRTFNLLGELEEETVNEFDSNNKCIGSKRYDGDGNLTSYDENTFQNGKLSRSDTYDSSGRLTGYSLYEYDGQTYQGGMTFLCSEDRWYVQYLYRERATPFLQKMSESEYLATPGLE